MQGEHVINWPTQIKGLKTKQKAEQVMPNSAIKAHATLGQPTPT